MRTAVYCATRNLYYDLIPAVNSLLAHDGADRIVLMIEDDALPYPLPPRCEIRNVAGQTWFRHDGPNFGKYYTYMVLMRAALSKELPEEDRALSLDVDTIVDGDISELWAMDLGTDFLAAASEPDRECLGGPYFQMGVVLFNLKQLRAEGVDDVIIADLNRIDFKFPEQDAINVNCFRRIAEMDSRFNCNEYTKPTNDARIYHFAGLRNYHKFPIVEQYRTL